MFLSQDLRETTINKTTTEIIMKISKESKNKAWLDVGISFFCILAKESNTCMPTCKVVEFITAKMWKQSGHSESSDIYFFSATKKDKIMLFVGKC